MIGLLIAAIATLAALVVLALLPLMVAKRLGGKRAVWAVGTVIVGLIAFQAIDTLRVCNSEPVFTPPLCDDPNRCGIGRVVFACDGPVGAIAYGFAYLIAPLAVACVGFLTFLVSRRVKNMKLET